MQKEKNGLNTPSLKTCLCILAAAVMIAIIAFIATKGRLDLRMLTRTTDQPKDRAENMVYEVLYRPSSENILERDGILVKNLGNQLQAIEITGGIRLKAAEISQRSDLPILQFSEYVGYFYLYDGKTLYRTNVDGSNLKATVKNCLKYEIMGNFIYSLKFYHGQKKLFRCSIIGTYENMLFSEEVLDFWAYGGHLLMKLTDGQYRYYHVLDGNSQVFALPSDASDIALCGEGILYLSEQGHPGRTALYCRDFLSQKETEITFEKDKTKQVSVSDFVFGPGGIGVLLSGTSKGGMWDFDKDKLYAAWCSPDGRQVFWYSEKGFEPESRLDMGTKYLFITDADGVTWYTALERENWQAIERQ